MPERPRVLQMGPDPRIGGGMAAALLSLQGSPLAERYRLELCATYRGPAPLGRLVVFATALARLTAWSLLGRGRLVHVHATVRGSAYRKAIIVPLAKALRRRVVLQLHSGPGDLATFSARLPPLRRRAIGSGLGAADRIVAVSQASATAAEAAYGLSDVGVVPNAAPHVPAFERTQPAAGEPVEAVYLGGFANTAKGGETMLAAVRASLAAAPSLHLVLAGPGEPPAELEGLGDRVRWLGWLEAGAKDELLRRAQIFVLPSTSEGLPMAILEAMAYGLAIAATRVGGVPDTLADGEEGLLVEPKDPAALADAIVRLVGDPALRCRLGEAARERAGQLDDVEVARRLEQIYESLL